MSSPVAKKKNWKEFRNTGLLWFINQTLHLFGWAIVFSIDEKGDVVDVYPARVNFRGFPEDINTGGYKKLTGYLANNIQKLSEDVNDSDEDVEVDKNEEI